MIHAISPNRVIEDPAAFTKLMKNRSSRSFGNIDKGNSALTPAERVHVIGQKWRGPGVAGGEDDLVERLAHPVFEDDVIRPPAVTISL